jgi:hypothetical protein
MPRINEYSGRTVYQVCIAVIGRHGTPEKAVEILQYFHRLSFPPFRLLVTENLLEYPFIPAPIKLVILPMKTVVSRFWPVFGIFPHWREIGKDISMAKHGCQGIS